VRCLTSISLPSLAAPQSSTGEDGSYGELNSENIPAPHTQQQLTQQQQRSAHKLTFVERSVLQQDITRGQIIPSTFQPVTIIWNRRLDVKERNLIINNYTSGSAGGGIGGGSESALLLDNSALVNRSGGNVTMSISTPKRPSGGGGGASGASAINSNRALPWASIRQTLEEGSGAGSEHGSSRYV
jgi:hypothetical protein